MKYVGRHRRVTDPSYHLVQADPHAIFTTLNSFVLIFIFLFLLFYPRKIDLLFRDKEVWAFLPPTVLSTQVCDPLFP